MNNNWSVFGFLDINSLSSFEGTILQLNNSSGDNGEEVTPVPMPNTEVKLFSADGSWGISPCESRTSPGNVKKE
jgi:hypothetical protein